MGAADMAFVLWSRFLRYDPKHPQWPDRDRFVLSAGHGCMLLYGLLHLAGYDLSLSELESRFVSGAARRPATRNSGTPWASRRPPGRWARASATRSAWRCRRKMLAARFNDGDRFNPVGHRIFVHRQRRRPDGGHQRRGVRLWPGTWGSATWSCSTTTIGSRSRARPTWPSPRTSAARRYESYGWQAQRVDGHDHDAIAAAIEVATQSDKPSMILCRTHIAHGAPTKQDTADSHGSPLGAEEIAAAKKAHWTGPRRTDVLHPRTRCKTSSSARAEEGRRFARRGKSRFRRLARGESREGASWDAIWSRRVPEDITDRLLAERTTGRRRAQRVPTAVSCCSRRRTLVPGLVGGSADSRRRPRRVIKDSPAVAPGDFSGRNIHFGIREHAMGAIQNGMLYHGAFRPYGCDLPGLRRLHAAADPPRRAVRPARDLRLHARLDLRRRGRPDPRAGRARLLPCG